MGRSLPLVFASLLVLGCATASRPAPPHPAMAYGWSPDRVTATLRAALQQRGFDGDAVLGPMAARPPRDHPEADPLVEPPDVAALEWPPAAWAVVTGSGGVWWVWEYGATAPGDDLARRLSARHRHGGS
jgi:hypothetical protein